MSTFDTLRRRPEMVVIVCLLALASGCRKKAPPAEKNPAAATAPEEAPPPPDPLDTVMQECEARFQAGDTNGAIARVESALADPVLKDRRTQVFAMLVRQLLAAERVADAQERLRAAYRDEPELAREAFDLVYQHLGESGRTDEALAWADEVLSIATLPADMRAAMHEWRLGALIGLPRDADTVKAAGEMLEALPPGDGAELLRRTVDGLFERGRLAVAGSLLDLADARKPEAGSALANLVLSGRVRLLASAGKWEDLRAAYASASAALPDDDLQRLFRQTVALAAKAKQGALVDELCEAAIFRPAGKTRTQVAAARQWVEAGMGRDPALLSERLDALLRAKVAVGEVANLYSRYFYDTINAPKLVKPMIDLGQRILPQVEDENMRNAMRTMVLDGSFVLEDYDTALQMLTAGIAGRDEHWHDMAISKVKAHKALKEGRPRDAVQGFREFMVHIANGKDEDTSDPATGIVHTKDMILGRNAKRIGDILAGIPDAEAAKQAYTEARGYYEKALKAKEVADKPETRRIIEEELAGVPK